MQDKEKTDREAESTQVMDTGSWDTLKLQLRLLIRLPARHNPNLRKIIDRVNANDELTIRSVASK
jgi:hypothetical protein